MSDDQDGCDVWVGECFFWYRPTWVVPDTHTHLFNGPFPGLPRWAGTRKVKPVWILLKQETLSGIGISWAICKSAPCSIKITSTPTTPGWMPFQLPNQQHQITEGTSPGQRAVKWLCVCACCHLVIEPSKILDCSYSAALALTEHTIGQQLS